MRTYETFKPDVLIYHFPKSAPCSDGFGARMVASLRDPKIVLIPFDHKDEIPVGLVLGKRVLMIDCCYRRDMLLKLKELAEDVLVLDHHDSAMRDCGDLPFCHFDMDHSGIYLAWEFFNSEVADIPAIVYHIQNRDLGRFNRQGMDFCSALDALGMNHETWAECFGIPLGSPQESEMISRGAIYREEHARLARVISERSQDIHIGALRGKAVNIGAPFNSSVPNLLCQDPTVDFGLAYTIEYVEGKGSMARLSFRTKKDLPELVRFAESVGGGGHPKACGAIIPIQELGKLLGWVQPQ